jgi:hypothetical protein
MDNLMSPYSNLSMGTTTPLHHPDEDLANFQHQQTNNVYLPKQMNFSAPPHAPPPLMMTQPQTPVSIFYVFHPCLCKSRFETYFTHSSKATSSR